ncbi:MAG TPA: hypothetical protein VF487_06505 [Chitinophagaceae bacterium]
MSRKTDKRQLSIMQHWWKAILLSLLLFPLKSFAQDITGIWTGFLKTAEGPLHYELAISGDKEKFTGYSLTVFMFDGVENTGVKSVKLKNKKGKISLEDNEMIYNNYTSPPKRVVLFGDLVLKKKDTTMILEGTFSTRAMDMRYDTRYVIKGTLYLQKQNNSAHTPLLSKLDEMNLLSGLSFIPSTLKQKEIVAATITNRNTEVLTTVYFNSDSLTISLFDNGQVDGDTVSVILNGKVIISKKGLTARAITQTIDMTSFPGDSLVLVMYAENLGTIPPNTGLLIVEDGEARHEIRFAGDLQKNSAIVLRRK